jgi:hypothetical protein
MEKMPEINNPICKQLSEQWLQLIEGDNWTAINYRESLENTNLAEIQQEINQRTAIEILAHLHYYIKGLNRYFEEGIFELKDLLSFETPELLNEVDWENYKNTFFNDAAGFAKHLAEIPDEQLLKDFVKPEYGNTLRNLCGMSEHAHYHLAQIRELIKAARAELKTGD